MHRWANTAAPGPAARNTGFPRSNPRPPPRNSPTIDRLDQAAGPIVGEHAFDRDLRINRFGDEVLAVEEDHAVDPPQSRVTTTPDERMLTARNAPDVHTPEIVHLMC